MHVYRTASAALVLAALTACGGGGKTGPSLTVTSLSISPATAMLKIKSAETFTATVKMSDGSTTTVSPTWRSANSGIVTVDANGRATAVASGTTVITAEYQGQSDTRDLRVVPDYHGTWTGRLNVLTCTDDGDWHTGDFCKELGTGDIDDITLSASQSNAAITGTLNVGGLAGPVTGSIGNDGTLTVTGEYTTSALGYPVQVRIPDWQTVSTDNSRMTGRLTFTVGATFMTGTGRVNSELLNMNKTSSSAFAAVRSAQGKLAESVRQAGRRH